MADNKKNKQYFAPVNSNADFPTLEKEIIEFWKENNTFEKSVKKNEGKKTFVFYEGPPTANGKPGIHHVLARSYKDLFPRYHNMKGEYSLRKAGWDTHGLPVELAVEKELGISGKKQIENIVPGDKKASIAKFNELCEKSVFKYVNEWTDLTQRMGYWVNLKDPYITYSKNYIESDWAILKNFFDKGLLEKDYKVVPYCPRCETPLSSHELSQGYEDVEDTSVYIRFRIKDEDADFLAWTTTPWTLPANVALAVDPKATYVMVETEERPVILVKERAEKLFKNPKVLKEYKGEELLGKKYTPLFDFHDYGGKAHFVVPADFVSLEEGTGIVHTAVMYGADDFRLGKENDLPMHHMVNGEGKFTDEVTPWKGMFVKKADPLVIADLKEKGLLFKEEKITHSYPFCWRCHTPLIYYAIQSWFIKTTKEKEKIIGENAKINWVPKHMKTGRMGKWLEGMVDWSLSRFRFWGTPLPIWKCNKCDQEVAVGSFKELGELSEKDLTDNFNPHKPYIDEIKFACSCGGEMERYPELIDVWFDSGAMPFGQWHYPFENKDKIDECKQFPADFIAEGQDQTRGWFYTLLVISTLYKGQASFKNVISHNLVLDSKGKKMSKSLGNIVDPWSVMDKFGADTVRWYFYRGNPSSPILFDEKALTDVVRRFTKILWNTYNFLITYAGIDNWVPGEDKTEKKSVLDRWIMSRLNETVEGTSKALDKYHADHATELIEGFVNDLSLWYVRRSRDRIGPAAESEDDRDAFYQTIYQVLTTLSKLLAPFMPFMSDAMYKNLTKEESVHLSDWPEVNGEIDKKLISDMEKVRSLVEKVHAARKLSEMAVKRPLVSATVSNVFENLPKELLDLALGEVNVKELKFEKFEEEKVVLDTTITPEIEEETKTRELIRQIQEERKRLGLNLSQKVNILNPWLPKVDENIERIKRKTLAENIEIGEFKVEKLG